MKFTDYLTRWNLIVDGDAITTHSSQLLPVLYQGNKAMLKIAMSQEEVLGANLMVWWEGQGAARVLIHEENALLMERANNNISLADKARHGHDSQASQIICSVAAKLHMHKSNPPKLLPLKTWFKSLEIADVKHGGIFSHAFKIANELLNSPQDVVVLHGDLHHGNILDFGARGWLAIDPKHIMGERGYDFANIFCNPDEEVALQPGRLLQQLNVVADCAQLESNRLVKWILAYAGLSAAWSLEDGDSPKLALSIAQIARHELEQ